MYRLVIKMIVMVTCDYGLVHFVYKLSNVIWLNLML
ncbi:hypothetical protein F383_08101 [Gossypium arboreum]|uniref:Uncharacterized protein n=1 Tax=Gossypium arboreum TaxID=29729 RepID=A0A0B0PQ88_GOSAR|nr:hypothetical protein F383_13203 [Gossypium arboreum]KHG27155.1 hypothetical protein F383_08101 [Gossypium arboreum]